MEVLHVLNCTLTFCVIPDDGYSYQLKCVGITFT